MISLFFWDDIFALLEEPRYLSPGPQIQEGVSSYRLIRRSDTRHCQKLFCGWVSQCCSPGFLVGPLVPQGYRVLFSLVSFTMYNCSFLCKLCS